MVSRPVFAAALLLLCGFTIAHASVFQVKKFNNRYQIEHATDGNLHQALRSIDLPWTVKELDLSGNVLTRISGNDLNAFTSLELLNLSSNVFRDTVNLGSLTTLRTVDLNNNYINRVEVGSRIEVLHAANNEITSVSCYGQGTYGVPLYGAKKIYLANNKISSLHDLDESCRTAVEYLDVNLNEIDTLNLKDLSASQKTLKHLLMEYNFIYDIRSESGISFPNLDTLDVSSNKLAFMGPAFEAVANAKKINLTNNKLVLLHDIRFWQAHTVDLRGNGLQCETLRTFLGISKPKPANRKSVPRYAHPVEPELCADKQDPKRVHIYCCEELNAPFADRLIDMKRKELAIYSGQSTEQDRKECEQETMARQRKIDEIKKKYRTTIDAAVLREQSKLKLISENTVLEKQMTDLQQKITDLQNLLNDTAVNLALDQSTANQEPLALLQSIIQWFDDRYESEQREQNDAMRDIDRYQLQIDQLMQENERLKKLNVEADQAFASANQTYTSLLKQEQELSKQLATKVQ